MAFPTTPVLDNFNRATIGANWTGAVLDATPLPNPNGTQLPGDGGFDDAIWNVKTFKYPYEVFVTVAAKGAVSEAAMVYFIDNATGNGYAATIRQTDCLFVRIDAFGQTPLSGPSWTLANGDVVGFTATSNGTTVSLQAYKNGVAVGTPVTDTTYPVLATNRNLGLEIGADATIRLDDFGGGTSGGFVESLDRPVYYDDFGPSDFSGPNPFIEDLTVIAVSSTQTFSVNLTATVTTTASIQKQVNKLLSATSTTAASIQKQVNKFLSATSTTTSSIQKQVNKPLSATATSTASLVKQVNKALSATATTTASLVKQVNKNLTATATTTASLIKTVLKNLTATVTTTATMATLKVILLTLTANISTSASMLKTVNKSLLANVSSTATMVKKVLKNLTATVTSSATLQTLKVILLTLTANVSSTASIKKLVQKNLSATSLTSATIKKLVSVRMTATSTVAGSLTAFKHAAGGTVRTIHRIITSRFGIF